MTGQKVGSRVLAVIPPKDAFGATGNSSIGVGANDTVVFVIDMLKSFDNTAGVSGTQTSNGGGALPTVTAGAAGKGPTITIPNTAAPKTLQVKTLIKGTGPVVKKGQYLVVQYTGVNWRTKKVFDSSWSRSEPFATAIGEGQVIKGWDTGLVGQTVGSRVLLVIPPADGYGKSGSSVGRHQGHRHPRLRGRHHRRRLTRSRSLRAGSGSGYLPARPPRSRYPAPPRLSARHTLPGSQVRERSADMASESPAIRSKADPASAAFKRNAQVHAALAAELRERLAAAGRGRPGAGPAAARRRAASCCPGTGSTRCSIPASPFLELSPLAADGHVRRRGARRRASSPASAGSPAASAWSSPTTPPSRAAPTTR